MHLQWICTVFLALVRGFNLLPNLHLFRFRARHRRVHEKVLRLDGVKPGHPSLIFQYGELSGPSHLWQISSGCLRFTGLCFVVPGQRSGRLQG